MEKISVDELIEAQRKCSISSNPYERVVDSLLMAARLQKRISVLSDAAIGQLMFKHVWNVIHVFSPEFVICKVASERLIDSSCVVKSTKENLNQ